MTRPSRAVITIIAVVELLAVALWACGLVTLGAVVAPIVFRVVPSPGSADAMTLVFRRFDTIAITCAAVALVAEAAFAMRGGRVLRLDVVRGICLALAAALAIAVGAWVSPGIAALHAQGAIRHVGELGAAMERLHTLAEGLAKGELLLLLIVFGLTVVKATRPPVDGTPAANSAL